MRVISLLLFMFVVGTTAALVMEKSGRPIPYQAIFEKIDVAQFL